jgi:hypothetical protein
MTINSTTMSNINPMAISGGIKLLEVTNASGLLPGTVIPATDSRAVHVVWEIQGAIQGLLGGKWNITAYLKGIGVPIWERQVATTELPQARGKAMNRISEFIRRILKRLPVWRHRAHINLA